MIALFPGLPGAFVTLDTSAEGKQAVAPDTARTPPDTGKSPSAPDTEGSKAGKAGTAPPAHGDPAGTVPPGQPSPADAAFRSAKPHYHTALFLSADNMLIYSYLGVLKALEEYKLAPDILVVESKAVVLGAAWALGYRILRVEEKFLEKPLSAYLKPHRQHGSLTSRFTAYGPDPIQVEVPLGLQSLQSADLSWNDTPAPEGDEYLQLSWMIAKLTHDAPGGPVEDLQDAPKPLAVQVADLQDEKGKVLLEGNLQALLKGGMLPKDALHRRKRLWPLASGALISGHTLLTDALPFTFDRLLVVLPSRHLRPPSLEAGSDPWQDSLEQRLKTRSHPAAAGSASASAASNGGKMAPAAGSGRGALRIELNPDAGFDHDTRDPKAWIELGYASTLRSMDVLLSTLGSAAVPDSAARKGAAPRRVAVGPAGPVRLKAGAAGLPPPLGLDRLTVNPLASGGRQLLQDLVKKSVSERGDSTGDGPITDLIGSGYYSDLDVEWVSSPGDEYPALVFDAREKSRLLFQAAANVANSGEDLPDRGPEMFAGLIWSEPFYVPFRAEAAALLGGHRPGYSFRALVEPIHPMHLELGIGRTDWRIRYPDPPENTLDLNPLVFRLNRNRGEIFLNLFPTAGMRLSTAIQQHAMTDRTPVEGDDADAPPEARRGFESTDFQQTGFLGLGAPGPSGVHLHSLWLSYRNLNRVNLFGPVKFSSSSLEARLRLSLGDFRFMDQYHWSDKEVEEAELFDYLEAGEVKAFSFQDEYFYATLRGRHFQNVQAEYAPSFGRTGLRLLVGGFRHYGRTLSPTQGFQELYGRSLSPALGDDFTSIYWEAQLSHATPVGPFRVGLAGIQDDTPIFYIRIGADLDLEQDGY